MESPSDSVNGVNAVGPLDNDGSEKVVGTLLVDDSGPMEKRPQMAESKRIIIPFPFGNDDQQSRREKRAMDKTARILTGSTAGALAITIVLNVSALLMGFHISDVGKSNISSGYQNLHIVLIIFGIISAVAAGVLFISTIVHCVLNCAISGAGTGQSEVPMH